MTSILPKLSPRLKLLASKARPNKIICDIGTDHAYLPAFLVNKGISPFAIACDVKEGPLKRAENNINKFGVQDKVKLILSDGLERIEKTSFDDLIIAGMGGEQISDILSKAQWLKDGDRLLILQPMTSAEELKKYLYSNDYKITNEEIVREGLRYYIVITAKAGANKGIKRVHLYFGKSLIERNGSLEKQYLDRLIRKFTLALKGIEKGRDEQKLSEIKDILNQLLKVKESMQNGKG